MVKMEKGEKGSEEEELVMASSGTERNGGKMRWELVSDREDPGGVRKEHCK
jgi:hypothetical protein